MTNASAKTETLATKPAALELALTALAAAQADGKISTSAVENINGWLRKPHYADYVPLIIQHITNQQWRELDDAFWTVIPFGTAGRRGRMYPIGTNAINDRTMGESVQGLADYVLATQRPSANEKLRCVIAYDTRHRSRQFAELAAEIMAAAGFEVLMFDGFRPTPELSFTVRDRNCACGIMISASHNPPSDNAIKAFWSTGGQLRAPHDEGVIKCVDQVTTIKRIPFATALASGQIKFCQTEQDPRYQAAVLKQSQPGPRNLKILYSTLHGVGLTSVLPILHSAGFKDIEVYEPHSKPDGDFPNVPNHVANPENPAVFDVMIDYGKTHGIELILASDPDADRIGCAAPLTTAKDSPWSTLTGNQIGALIAELLLRRLKTSSHLTPEHYVIKTLVTSDMICRIADGFGVRSYGDLLTGFKWIGSKIEEVGPEKFVFGFEEAHGYLAGTYARDKDGSIAALLLAELAAECKTQGRTPHEQLDQLFQQYGCHLERSINHTLPGADGLAKMKTVMTKLRTNPPRQLGGLLVRQVRDYQQQQVLSFTDSQSTKTVAKMSGDVPRSDLLIFDLDPAGNRAAVRPSGTEPKLKFYLFAYEPPERSKNIAAVKKSLTERLSAIEADLLRASE
jgi:phosphomannomutase